MKALTVFTTFLLSFVINAQCIQKIACGSTHTLAIKTDGTLWSWGSGSQGELGNGSSDKYVPTQVGTLNDWQKIYAGIDCSFFIKSNGTLWDCGDGGFGQLGTGSQSNIYTPTQIGTDNDWVSVTSSLHTIAKKANGTVWGWGSNIYGELNLGTNSIVLSPVQISNETNWGKIVADGNHTLALKTNGTLWACGYNAFGQLGDGTIINKLNFVQIGTDSDWVDIETGLNHSIALKANGTIWGWGSNNNYVLALSSASQLNVPTQLSTATDWIKIETAYYYTTALKANGTLWRSKSSGFEQIGTDTNWADIESHGGSGFFFATKTDGTLWAYGGNDSGELGLGQAIPGVTTPTQLTCSAFLGIEEINPTTKIKLYPNPTNEVLFIENTSNNSIEKITLTDITGKIILVLHDNFFEINMRNFESGIYILNISSDNKIYNYKIVKK